LAESLGRFGANRRRALRLLIHAHVGGEPPVFAFLVDLAHSATRLAPRTRVLNQMRTAIAPTVELLAWVAEQSRSYAETIEVWKTSCPRLAVWEDALADDLVRIDRGCVLLTAAGSELLMREVPDD